MPTTMIKKRLASGEPCRKCAQAEEMLKKRGLWELVDNVVIADEKDPDSAGMLLARQHEIELAPFFIIEEAGKAPELYTSVIKFAKALQQRGASAKTPEGKTESVEEAAVRLAEASPYEVIGWALQRYGAGCAISFSGAEDVVLIDMALRSGHPFSVFSLDTGRLHPETYRFMNKVREKLGVEIQWFSPDPQLLQPFVRKKGLFSFYEDGHGECCQIRKVEPLKRALSQFSAWITGQRKDQSPTRTDLELLELEETFVGKDGAKLVKLNPLANWSSGQVWDYIDVRQLPYNELHDRGYISIGCEPCTRAVRPGEHERAGRWWWEEETKRECGLHVGNRDTQS